LLVVFLALENLILRKLALYTSFSRNAKNKRNLAKGMESKLIIVSADRCNDVSATAIIKFSNIIARDKKSSTLTDASENQLEKLAL